KAVGDLEQSTEGATVQAQTDVVRGRLTAAQDLADGGQYAEGKAILDKGAAEIAAAAKIALAHEAAAKERDGAQKPIEGIASNTKKALDAVEKMVAALKARPAADLVADEI